MARPGVTYFDIANAAEVIKTQGHEPTVDRVREQLGTGSKSTIAPLLKRWRTENEGSGHVQGLPTDLLETVKSLHQRLQELADQRIDESEKSFQAANDQLTQSLTAAHQRISQLTAEQEALEEQVAQLERDKSQQAQTLENTRLELVRSESQRSEAVKRTTELKDNIAELKQENKDIREHFDHYQQRTAADRQLEREQFRSTSQHQHDELQTLKHQLSAAQDRLNQLQDTNTELQLQQASLQDSNQSLKQDSQQLTVAMDNLTRELETTKTQNLAHQSQQQELQQAMASVTQQRSESDKERALMSLRWEATKSELGNLKAQLRDLSEENRLLLQEKAEILGKFKQLQQSRAQAD